MSLDDAVKMVQHMTVGPRDLVVVTLERSASERVVYEVLRRLEDARPDLVGIPARIIVVREDVRVELEDGAA
jgi:hypothetical protein